MTQEALPALSNQNDEEAARDEKGPEIFILSLAQDTSFWPVCLSDPVALGVAGSFVLVCLLESGVWSVVFNYWRQLTTHSWLRVCLRH
jgi:hypothetical protein